MLKAIIFDLDGVICSTDEYHYLAWKSMADDLGIWFDREINNRLRGVSRMASLDIVLERYDGPALSEADKLELADKKNAVYRGLLGHMSPEDLSEEVKTTLDTLRAQGLKLAIGSSSKNTPYILERLGLDGYFDAVSDGNNIIRSKPDPEVFLRAAEYLGEKPADCLVVEDAVSGAEAGHRGGFRVACVGDAARAGAGDWNLDSFAALPDAAKAFDAPQTSSGTHPGVAANPYLPLWEYVPDGEPRVFGDRLYLYGSHDRSGGQFFCLEDYVVWSAPLSDLSAWRFDGVSYRRDQDPHNPDGKWELFAPDVVRGVDGRYYLYYCLRMQQEFGVAVADRPEGPFAFYGHVKRPDGSIFDELMPYDPSVLVDDDGRVFLYYGYTSEAIAAKFGATVSPGGMVLELEQDMLTVRSGPKVALPRDIHTEGTGFEGHGYYEAPSVRKIHGKYYFVYSSEVCHELCCAVSDRPDEGYRYGGVIVSNGDIGLRGREYPTALPGNDHGGLAEVNGQFYIFYQRHTQCTQYSRQGCAEPVTILPDGSIPQVEISSGGLQNGPLPATGVWSAAYACHLTHRDGRKMRLYREADPSILPAIWEDTDEPDRTRRVQYIRNLTDGSAAGFKYFRANNVRQITLTLRGRGDGCFVILAGPLDGGAVLARLPVTGSADWKAWSAPVDWNETSALYLVYEGRGSLDLRDIRFD